MKTGIKEQAEVNPEIQAMTLLYKETYDALWKKIPKTSQNLIIEEPLGRRAKQFARDVAKKAESKRYDQLDNGEELY